ncbi:MAG: dimethylmenaquinone methyltransferase [Candidatus Dactylopiibacterium carminicum]|uniref:Dimethylmenaquinone methyltransferase n=1 Tax=Candidatus Dactylopiibacterium carminicum TaxID=857335 RepID=A0A272EQ20_9RHOO|nr:class I SAM-dependent methyltransferase [Candidatus Dactylopiibacterium carminicum]KAF7598468.1 dimethylmenaquinone methyltransferase [Candidatus Dactylopiibacterium carminicum]PAS92202.1 MAG: dimethylmenaquinone methyltransferase [Candidatus Dactylopiibacterium carminicum]PAS95717.1 MAG: dimethylmenaquinone methyltransferase [Candidatus Dactylopiibacterium carminicum]PAS97786.1 MAG: dimethylmenaquinone methyltransferase [Candidatus Dactylopiibacterium carminicum]
MSVDSRVLPAQAPHQPLTDYYASEAERAGFVRRMFDSTAEDYDRMETILGFGTGPWYRGEAMKRAGLLPGMSIVDVGTGTGLMARAAVQITGDAALVTGVDPSPGMMAQAQLPGVTLVEGRAEAIPYPDASFDFLSMGYALRHISDLSVAFREFHRVMKPGARLCLLEITRPESAWGRLLLKIYMKGLVPLLAYVVGRQKQGTCRLWRYYWDTIEACVPPAQVLATLEAAGFTCVRRHIETKGLSILAEYQAVKPH